MFRWQKEMRCLEVSSRKVLKIFRSLSDVQLALPGFPPQLATACVVSFATGKGVQTAVALNLTTSLLTAFYLHERKEVPPGEAEDVFEEGIRFAESMGFMLGDLDWQLLDAGKQEELWASLPLGQKTSPPAPAPASGRPDRPAKVNPAPESPPERPARPAVIDPAPASPLEHPARPAAVDPKPAAARRPASGSGKGDEPLPSDLETRRRRLRETIGRFLASL
jgi:hypothetical protein